MIRFLTLSVLPTVVATLLLSGSGATQAAAPWQPGDADPFAIFNEEATSRIEHARMRVRGECMVSKGYPGASTWIPEKVQNPETMKFGYSGLLFPTVEEARKHGFGSDDPGRTEMATGRRSNDDAASAAAFDEADTICMDQALAKAGGNAKKDYDDYIDLGQSMSGELNIATKDLVEESFDRVVQCLADQGYPVTRKADGIGGFDTEVAFGSRERTTEKPRIITRNGEQYVAAIKPNRYIPTAEESALASAYVECGKSTSAEANYVTSIRREQQRIVEKYQGQLAKLTPRIEAHAEKFGTITGS